MLKALGPHYEEDPETYGKGLSKKLTVAGADQDADILSAAQALLTSWVRTARKPANTM